MSKEEKVVLKDLYKDFFKIGVACENVTERFTNNEVGNPPKEKLMAAEFNSMTFGNQLKPMYNMGFNSPDAKEDFLPFVLNPDAKVMLEWARANNMPVRGHVMVWHSQCPKEIFCKGYKPVTIPTDPELLKTNPYLKHFEKLNPVCFVDRDTMLKRLKSYIFNLVEWMYKDGYQNLIYAWDVVNEAIELADKTETGVRKSYWTDTIGPDYIYWSFRFAYDAVEEMSKKYGGPKPILFYNDYNEFDPKKKEAIIANLNRQTSEHGSVISEGLLGGIGMQGHISDNNNIEEYREALMDYSKLTDNVHITELDVKCTCNNINQEYYQAVFYKEFFEMLLDAVKKGANLKCVTFWGLTDDNSWIRGANPLLFRKDLSEKKAYDALVYAVKGGDLGEPAKIEIDLSDRITDFEPVNGEACDYKAKGFKCRGFGELAIVDTVSHSGNHSLAAERRFDGWSGITMDVSDFIGQTIKISAWVKSPALKINLRPELNGSGETFPLLTSVNGGDDWAYLEAEYSVPSDVHSMFLFFDTDEADSAKYSAIYVDDVTVHLVGQFESFEGASHSAKIRGMGHLPFLMVTDKESIDGKSHSLQVTRQEKDATVKFDVSTYIGRDINIEMFVKTEDKTIKIGLDNPSTEFATFQTLPGWTKISATASVPKDLRSAEIYVETDGNKEMFIDDIKVTLA